MRGRDLGFNIQVSFWEGDLDPVGFKGSLNIFGHLVLDITPISSLSHPDPGLQSDSRIIEAA